MSTDLKKKLVDVELRLKQVEVAFQQLSGQKILLEGLIKDEEKVEEVKEEPKKEETNEGEKK